MHPDQFDEIMVEFRNINSSFRELVLETKALRIALENLNFILKGHLR